MTIVSMPSTEVFGAALRGEACDVLTSTDADHDDGVRLPVARWARRADRSDRTLLGHCRGATLDVGCGPGRMVEHLARCGYTALGIDISQEAVDQTIARGASALRRDIHGPLPAEGRWSSILLADGNIGIGGDPRRLLTRAAALLMPGGRVVVDLDPPGGGVRTTQLRLRTSSATSDSFAWSTVSADAVESLALASGLATARVLRDGARWFAVLTASAR